MGEKAGNELLQEAVQYFREQKGFARLALLFVDKYRSLGRCGGTVRLTSLTGSEREFLGHIFRRDYGRQQSAVVSLEKFQQALDKTRFAGVTLEELLEGYTGERLITKAEEREEYEAAKRTFFAGFLSRFPQPRCRRWLLNILEKGPYSRGVHLAYDNDREGLGQKLVRVLRALASLPSSEEGRTVVDPLRPAQGGSHRRFERLPLFAGRITGDPHLFDPDREEGRFLLSALQYLYKEETGTEGPGRVLTAEKAAEILQYFGLVRDDLLNFVTCAGLIAYREGRMLSSWQMAWEEGCVLNVPLREVLKLSAVFPGSGYFRPGREKRVFVVENSGVFSGLADHFAALPGGRLPPLLATHGQFNLAALLLLDLLAAGGATLYYSGDFDPEGLQMAQQLRKRYGQCLKLWHYEREDYEASRPGKILRPSRLKKLDSVQDPGLHPVKQGILSTREARYQEKILDRLIQDLADEFQ